MRLYFMLARRNPPKPSQIVIDVCRILAGRRIRTECGIAEEMLARPDVACAPYDLFLLKSYTPLALSMAGVLHAQGAPLLNPYPACMATRNKIVAAQLLRTYGIRAPRCWVTGDLSMLSAVVRETPLIVKPYMGWRGEGVQIVRNQRQLLALPKPEMPVLVQEYIPNDGEDLRLYVAGDQVFAVRKPFSSTSFDLPGRQVAVTREMRRIAVCCGAAFGLGLYGLDIIESASGPHVVDVNYFPGYKGIPEGAEAVADYIENYATGAASIPAEMAACR
jgi:ribosomal protein S6--L-glutamate ligase